MRLYNVIYKKRADLEGLSNAEKLTSRPKVRRIAASDATAASNKAVNELKDAGDITSKREIIIDEVKVGV